MVRLAGGAADEAHQLQVCQSPRETGLRLVIGRSAHTAHGGKGLQHIVQVDEPRTLAMQLIQNDGVGMVLSCSVT